MRSVSGAAIIAVTMQAAAMNTTRGARWLDAFPRVVGEHGDHAALWPLLIGAWKRKPGAAR